MFYSLIRFLFGLFFRIFYGCKFVYFENIPSGGSYIICSNHTSLLDPPFVGTIFHNRIYFMAKEELFNYFLLGRAIRALGAFPVKRNSADKRSLSHALKLLEEGKIVGLFPEGTRIRTGEIGDLFHGPAYLALKSKKPILPVAIKWPEKIFKPVKVQVGPLIYFEEEGKIRRKELEKASSKIMKEMTRLWSSF